MKRFSISFSVFLLAFLVLLGSGGYTVGKMICGGEECAVTEYSLGKAKDCCASGNTSAESLSCCCELIDVSYSLDEFSVSEKVTVSPQQFDLFHFSTDHCQLPAFRFSKVAFSFTDISPPDPQDYLHLIGSLLL